MLTICFEEEGIISGCVSESGYIEFHMWKKCGSQFGLYQKTLLLLHGLLCCFKRVIIVVCSVYIAKYGLDMTHVQCCQGNMLTQ